MNDEVYNLFAGFGPMIRKKLDAELLMPIDYRMKVGLGTNYEIRFKADGDLYSANIFEPMAVSNESPTLVHIRRLNTMKDFTN